nr:zinc finger, CCHC-type [Tanacetum cinerariifolium]
MPSILSQAEGHRYIFQYHFGKKAKPGRPNITLNDVLKLSTQPLLALPEPKSTNSPPAKILEESSTSTDPPSTTEGHLPTATAKDNVTEVGIGSKGFLEFFDYSGSRQGVEDLREGAQGDREAKVFQVSNDDTAVAQRRLEDKKPEEKTNTDCLIKEYRGDINEVAFAVAVVEKLYAHESLTFNNTVSFEVISKWKARLKDDMDARSDAYMLSNSCRKSSDDRDGYYWGYIPGNVPGMEIVRDQSCYTLRVSRSRFYNGKLVQTLLEGHSILLVGGCSLEGRLSGDCDVEKNGKWSCIYAVGSQEYQMVCTILDIASADGINHRVWVDDSMKANLQHMEALSTTKAGYMTFTKAWKKKMWLKGLLTESRYELRLVAGIATCALVKGGSQFEVPTQVEVAAYRGHANLLCIVPILSDAPEGTRVDDVGQILDVDTITDGQSLYF